MQWKYQRFVKDYLRCVDAVDENVGRMLEYLDETGLAKNTVVIYTSDQGWYLGEHGWYDKRWMYEESFRTPLLVRWPGDDGPGSVNRHGDEPRLRRDVPRHRRAGVPADMQGRSIKPILKNQTPGLAQERLLPLLRIPQPHNVIRHYGVRTDRYKLIHFYKIDAWELFDLEKDPNELRSAHADPAYAGIRSELAAELKRLRTLHKVPEDNRP